MRPWCPYVGLRRWILQEIGIHPCLLSSTWGVCWRGPSGGMKSCCMQCPACGSSRSPYWTPKLFKNTEYIMTEFWTMPMQSSPFPTTTLIPWVCSFLAGSLVLIACTLWSSYWSHCNCMNNSSSCLTGHFSCFSDCWCRFDEVGVGDI